MDEISLRLYNLLSTSHEESHCDLSAQQPDSESEMPLECCFCSKLFFNELKFHLHKCEQKLLEKVITKPDVVHKCTFGECKKVFNKSSDLRKHEVSNFTEELSDKC